MTIGETRRRAVDGSDEPASAPLVIVASEHIDTQLRALAQAGWTGPVVLVSSPAEARGVLAVAVVTKIDQPAEGAAPPTLPIELDPDRQVVVHGRHEAHLTPLEFGLLEALAVVPGQVRRFPDLVREVWGTSHLGDGAQVHSVVKRLRRKLEDLRAPVDLEAVRGVGFRLVGRPHLTSVGR